MSNKKKVEFKFDERSYESGSPEVTPGVGMPAGSMFRVLCSDHPNVNYKTALGCPDCLMELRIALRESVKLQSHYAKLLNQWDGGHRIIFKNSDAWISRLRETETIPQLSPLTSGVSWG